MEILPGDLVIPIAGRDKDELCYVLNVDGQFLLLANGKSRKLENPKRKKLIHVRKLSLTPTRVAVKIASGDKVLNSELRRDLAIISQQCKSQNQGG